VGDQRHLEDQFAAAVPPGGSDDTPKERQCRALLSGTPEDRKLARRVYNYKLIKRIEREIEARNSARHPS